MQNYAGRLGHPINWRDSVDKFILPNFHAILIHFPIGMLSIGVLIELFSFIWPRSSFRTAGRWMILLGTLAAVPAVTSGFYALHDVAGHGSETDSFIEFKAGSNFSDTDWRFVRYHVLLNSGATILALIAVVMWIGASDQWRKILRVPALVMLLAALGLMTDGAWHGGEMVYRLGFAVHGQQAVLPDNPTKPQNLQDKIEYYAPEGEVHLLMAGLVFALAAVSLGLTIRRAVMTDSVVVERVPPTYVPKNVAGQPIKPISLLQALNDPGDEIPVVPRVPAARFWMLAAVITLGALASGLWFGGFLAPWPKIIDQSHLRWSLEHIKDADHAREGMHIVVGASLLILIFAMALLTRFSPRSRVILSGLSLLLVLAMAAQIWIGLSLLFDGGRGALAHFKTQAEVDKSEHENAAPTTFPTTVPSATTQPIAAAN
jgi:uncharacterized membrane protein